jgi:hypothetical protein
MVTSTTSAELRRGEEKMHLKAAGLWWGEEVKADVEMCWLMHKQPDFVIIAVYAAWIYAQFTMIMMVGIASYLKAQRVC